MVLVGSLALLGFGGWRWWASSHTTSGDAWSALAPALAKVKSGADAAICEQVPEGAPRLNCLLVAADHALHVQDLSALEATCARMPDAVWRESCLLDAIAIDPALTLVSYVDACEAKTPSLAWHCESHARNRMKLFPREIPLAPEDHPEEMVRVFPTLVARHTVPENEETAEAFGKRLHTFGRPASDCDGIEASLRASCAKGWAAAE